MNLLIEIVAKMSAKKLSIVVVVVGSILMSTTDLFSFIYSINYKPFSNWIKTEKFAGMPKQNTWQ